MSNKKLRVAVVGLNFGASFPVMYKEHPDVEYVGICDIDKAVMDAFGDEHGVTRRHTGYDEMIRSGEYEAVHINTPIPLHAEMTVAALEAGLHCACAVPMATSMDEIKKIIAAARKSGKKYMMMETAAYTYQCLEARRMADEGEFGRIQFLRGCHYQDMENWPGYWRGLPPMHYSTHALAPLMAVADTRAVKVHCLGSGWMREELVKNYNNPFPIETAIFSMEQPGLAAEVTRTLFGVPRKLHEGFNIYGEKAALEWHLGHERLIKFTIAADQIPPGRWGRRMDFQRVDSRTFAERLPEKLRHYTDIHIIPDTSNPPMTIELGGMHHGSHPHLVHEFVRCIAEDRPSFINEVRAADITAAGLCAHISAMENGAAVEIPDFRL